MYSPSSVQQRRANEFGAAQHHGEADRAEAERENDAILKALMSDIKTIKSTSKGIRGELDRQGQLIDLLSTSFQKAQGALGKAMRRVGEVGGMSSHTHMWLLIVFAFCVFLFIWFMMKVK